MVHTNTWKLRKRSTELNRKWCCRCPIPLTSVIPQKHSHLLFESNSEMCVNNKIRCVAQVHYVASFSVEQAGGQTETEENSWNRRDSQQYYKRLLKSKSHGLHPEYLVLIYSEITLIDFEKWNAPWNLLGSSLYCLVCTFSLMYQSLPQAPVCAPKSQSNVYHKTCLIFYKRLQ